MPSRLIEPDSSRGELMYRWVQNLPGDRFLLSIQSKTQESTGFYGGSISKPTQRSKVLTVSTSAIYAHGNNRKSYLLWQRGTTVVAQEFDPRAMRMSGEPEPILDDLSPSSSGEMHVAASSNGLLVYGGFGEMQQLGWLDRAGKPLGQIGEAGDPILFRMAPDESRILVQRRDAGTSDLWLLDTEHGVSSRFTSDGATNNPAGLVP